MHRFFDIELLSDRFRDQTTLSFRRRPEKRNVGEQIFEIIKAHLSTQAMTIPLGKILDAAHVAVPSCHKDKAGVRDQEMLQTKSCN